MRSHRTLLAALAVAVVGGAGLVAAVQLPAQPTELAPSPAVTIPDVTGPVVRIAPDGTGDGGSGEWADAAALADLPRILETATPGTQVWLLADDGPYPLTKPLPLRHGGTAEAPVIVRGVDRGGSPRPAEIVGDRAEPFDPAGAPGPEVFRLLAGSDHLVFQELAFRNVGNGAFRIGADIAGLTIRQSTGTNVRRFIENTASEGASASVTGLTVTNVDVDGYSRGVARLRYDSNDILFDGVTGDSQGQDGDPFAMGIHLADTVHDADIRNATMANSISTQGEYWNGDGFVTERDTYDIRFTSTRSTGHTDAGYDLKSRSATLLDIHASDSKRNFRFHGTATVDGCTAADPYKRGGSGTQAQIHVTSTADVTVRNCTLTDDDPATIVFDVDQTARLSVTETIVERAPDARIQTVEPGAPPPAIDVDDRPGSR